MSLRHAFYRWARTSIQQDDQAYRYQIAPRAGGAFFCRALRSQADQWLRALLAMIRARPLPGPDRAAASRTRTSDP